MGMNPGLTFVNKQQLSLVDVSLGEVEHRLGGGALQGQVSVAGWHHREVELLWGGVQVLGLQVVRPDLGHRRHPDLDRTWQGFNLGVETIFYDTLGINNSVFPALEKAILSVG